MTMRSLLRTLLLVTPLVLACSADAAELSYTVRKEWSSGLVADLAITNTSLSPVNNWVLEFDYPHAITKTWNSKIVSKNGNRYIIAGTGSGSLPANGTARLGFNADKSGVASAKPTNCRLNGQPVTGADCDGISVPPPAGNQAPIANANGPYTGNAGQAIAFSSGGSSDPDGQIIAYSWDFGDGSMSSSAFVSHSYSTPGTYLVNLTVTDNKQAKSIVRTTAVISPVTTPPPAPPSSSNFVYYHSLDSLPAGVLSKQDVIDNFYSYGPSGVDAGRLYADSKERMGSSGKSLRVTFPKGQVTPSDSGVQIRIPIGKSWKDNNFQADELYFSYWFKFSNDFELNCGGKMPGLAGAQIGSNHTQRWTGRWMFRYGGSIQYYMHYADKGEGDDQATFLDWGQKLADEAPGDCADEVWTPYLKTGKWHHIELRYKLNTPGKADGELEGWLDGNAAHYLRKSVADFRIKDRSDNITLNAIFFSTFYGGSKSYFAPSKDVYAWFDELIVSRTRIGLREPK